MTQDEIRARLLGLLGNVAPDVDLAHVQPNRNLRAQIEIDSMDFLNFVIAIDRELHVAIPEADYGRLTTLDELARYVEEHLGIAAPHSGS